MFSRIPNGWKQQKPGVLVPVPTPHDSSIKKLKSENAALNQQLAELAERMAALESAARTGSQGSQQE